MRRAAHLSRRDKNEPHLVQLARRLGVQMERINEPCDWLAGFRCKWTPVEVKEESGLLTPGQLRFSERCSLAGLPFSIWRCDEDVYRFVDARRAA